MAAVTQCKIAVCNAPGADIDEAALYTALKEGKLAGAGLDVFLEELPDPSSPLFELPQIVMSPHSGTHTVEAIDRMGIIVAQNLVKVLKGEPPVAIVNPEVLGGLSYYD